MPAPLPARPCPLLSWASLSWSSEPVAPSPPPEGCGAGAVPRSSTARVMCAVTVSWGRCELLRFLRPDTRRRPSSTARAAGALAGASSAPARRQGRPGLLLLGPLVRAALPSQPLVRGCRETRRAPVGRSRPPRPRDRRRVGTSAATLARRAGSCLRVGGGGGVVTGFPRCRASLGAHLRAARVTARLADHARRLRPGPRPGSSPSRHRGRGTSRPRPTTQRPAWPHPTTGSRRSPPGCRA